MKMKSKRENSNFVVVFFMNLSPRFYKIIIIYLILQLITHFTTYFIKIFHNSNFMQ
jgi:hypothetical protein